MSRAIGHVIINVDDLERNSQTPSARPVSAAIYLIINLRAWYRQSRSPHRLTATSRMWKDESRESMNARRRDNCAAKPAEVSRSRAPRSAEAITEGAASRILQSMGTAQPGLASTKHDAAQVLREDQERGLIGV